MEEVPENPVGWVGEWFVLFKESNSFERSGWVSGGAPFEELGAELVVVLESGNGCGIDVGWGEV